MNVSANIIDGDLNACTTNIRTSLEEIVLKWEHTIAEVVRDSSFKIFNDIQQPMPSHETTFWTGRLSNLQYIYEQLCDPRIKMIASILQKIDSFYFRTFKETFESVVENLHEAQDVTLHLKPLVND